MTEQTYAAWLGVTIGICCVLVWIPFLWEKYKKHECQWDHCPHKRRLRHFN